MLKRSLITIFLLVGAFLVCVQQTAKAQSNNRSTTGSNATISPECRTDLAESKRAENGIFVGDVKVYDDRSLQTLLNSLRVRLAQISGLDQNTLIGRIGSLQGASISQLGFSVQGSGMPFPGSTTTSSPSGVQTQVTSPTITPTPPSLPNAPTFSSPSTFSQSALNTLNEQMQLSYEIINLQMLLEGSLNDQYVRGTNIRKRHVTLGFPISITVPTKDYEDAVAEVKITACNLPGVDSFEPHLEPLEPPSLMTVLPREKTYNVGTISNKLASLGASAIVSGIINLGASFLWSHQTYYIVQDQDTIAIQRPPQSSGCVIFVWQFRPVLGEKKVRQGLRQTFAQISFPPPSLKEPSRGIGKESKEPNYIGGIKVETKWREYNRKTGIVGDDLASSQVSSYSCISNFDKSLPPAGLKIIDSYDGMVTVKAWGNYQSRTRVRIGSLFLDESTPGFQQTPEYIKFIAPAQPLALKALKGASLVSPSGLEHELGYGWDDVSEGTEEGSTDKVKLAIVGTNMVEVSVPKGSLKISKSCNTTKCNKEEIEATLKGDYDKGGSGGPFPLLVTIGGKAFGLGDAPFKSDGKDYLTFLVSKDFVKSQRTLGVKRLLLGQQFMRSYNIPELFDVTGLTVLSANEKYTGFALLGTGLDRNIRILYPFGIELSVKDEGGTMAFFQLSTEQLGGLKQIVLQRGSDPPILVAIPDSKSSEKKTTLSVHDPIEVATGVTYTVSGPMAESIAAIQYLDKKLPFILSLDKKSVTLKLPDDITGTAGIRWLDIIYSDKSTERYKVEVRNPKGK